MLQSLLAAVALALPPPDGYYDSVDESSPEALRASLHEIIDDHVRFPYTSDAPDTWDILEMADEDPADASRIITLYRNASEQKRGGGNDDYNREHTWPRSYGFPDNGGYSGGASSFVVGSGPVVLGKNQLSNLGPDVFFEGAIDELAIYDRPLSPTEVFLLFRAGGRMDS